MRHLLLASVFLCGLAQGAVTQVNHYLGEEVRVIEIKDIKIVNQSVGKTSKDVLDSKMEIEVTGVYEGNGPSSTIAAYLDKVDDGNPISYQSWRVRLFDVNQATSALPTGGGARLAVSHPTDFTVRFELKPNWWLGDKRAEFVVAFKYTSYHPVHHDVNRGISATLMDRGGKLEWSHYNFGF